MSKTKKSNQRAKPFMVRLPTTEIREAYQRYCDNNLRSLDAQTSIIIMNVLKKDGFISSEMKIGGQ